MSIEYRNFVKKLFPNILKGNFDIYQAFILASIEKLDNEGVMVMITPNNYLTSKSCSLLREYLISRKFITEIIDYGSEKVFKNISFVFCN